jgi:tRNA dimethylallyltransferase
LEKVVVIVGPTCSGKTKLSLILAEIFKTEIISADSRQIYKLLDIGTAKPSYSELKKIKHYFIDDLDPTENFNANEFEQNTETILKDLHLRNKIPIVVGGSGLYIKALIDGIVESADSNFQLKNELLELRQKFGNEYLYNELKKVDPDSASRMLPQNWKRVIRALEVYKLTGKSISNHFLEQKKKNEFNFLQYGLLWDRKKLYQNIEIRVDKMIKDGLVDEVKEILKKSYSKELNSLNTVGYKEIIDYLANKISLENAVELIKRNTRRYAKRQMTWFRADDRIKWFEITDSKELETIAQKIFKDVNERKN